MTDATQILTQIESGDPRAAELLLPLVYDELRQLAATRLVHEKSGQTLGATALVHEAYIRLVDVSRAQDWNGRGHFFSAAAEAMRRILIEKARQKQAKKSGGGRRKLPLEDGDLGLLTHSQNLLAVNDTLDRLAGEAADVAELVKLRVFVGMTVNEAAKALNISRTTAFRHWTYARAWLRAEFTDNS